MSYCITKGLPSITTNLVSGELKCFDGILNLLRSMSTSTGALFLAIFWLTKVFGGSSFLGWKDLTIDFLENDYNSYFDKRIFIIDFLENDDVIFYNIGFFQIIGWAFIFSVFSWPCSIFLLLLEQQTSLFLTSLVFQAFFLTRLRTYYGTPECFPSKANRFQFFPLFWKQAWDIWNQKMLMCRPNYQVVSWTSFWKHLVWSSLAENWCSKSYQLYNWLSFDSRCTFQEPFLADGIPSGMDA